MGGPRSADLERALVETTLDLCRIPSVTGDEKAIADHVEARLRRRGAGEVLRFRDSVVARLAAPDPAKRTVALFGHLDTVPPRQDGPVRVEGDRIVACGASDMKSGLAVMIELLLRLDPDRLAVNVVACFYEREEGDYELNGLGPLLAEVPALRGLDLAFCLEPSSNHLQLGSLGGIHCTLAFHGSRAHSARPWQGENAVHKAGPLLTELLAKERVPVAFGDLVFYEVWSVTMVEATGTRNVVPDTFRMNLNYRFAPGRSLDEAKEDVLRLVAGRCEVEWTDLSPSGPVCLSNPLLRPLLDDPTVAVEPKQAWTDVARLGLHGIDAVNLGPGEGAQAHQRNESTSIPLLVDGYRLFERYLTGL